MIEKERKFLYNFDSNYIANVGELKIEQGYLMLDAKKHLRVRIINKEKAFFCYKEFKSNEIRLEYEYEIPISDALELMSSTKIKLSKSRFSIHYPNFNIDIDIYDNNTGVVEIEYKGEFDFKLPSCCGREITGIAEFSNIQIALNNKY